MKKLLKYSLYSLILALSFFIGRNSINIIPHITIDAGDATIGLPKEEKEIFEFTMPWLKNAINYRAGKYHIYTPNKKNPNVLQLNYDNYTFYTDNDGVSFGDNNNSAITIINNNLSYEFIDKSGKVIGQLTDANRDGQADTIMYYNTKTVKVWVSGAWYTYKSRNKKKGILRNGEWLAVKSNNGVYSFINMPNNKINKDNLLSGQNPPTE